jgi:hypothetical protein
MIGFRCTLQMALAEQFDLLELIQRDTAETWLAVEKSSRRRLLLHRFREDTGLRKRLLSMGPADLIMLVAAEQEQDGYVVVTHDLAPLRQFSQWVKERSDIAAQKVSESKPSAPFDPDRTQLTPRPGGPKAASGFEAMFEPPASGPATSPFADAPDRITASVPTPKEATGTEPGEFTRLFQTPVAGPAKTSTVSGNPSVPQPERRAEPGEFTRMFQAFPMSGESTTAPKVDAPEKKDAGGDPGEFTRLFSAPLKPQVGLSETATGRSNPVKKIEGPGEFTKMFETPFASRPEPERPSVQPPMPAPSIPSKPQPSEFTKIFGRLSQEPERDAAFDGGRATGVFSRPQVSASASNPAPQVTGPSEYTVFMQASEPAPAAPAPAPEPASAKEEAKAPGTAVNTKNAVVLTIILAVLVMAAVALLLYFFAKR